MTPKGGRPNRVSEELREILAEEIPKLKDPRVGFVTVTGVSVTPDLRLARVCPWRRFRPICELPCLLGHALIPSVREGESWRRRRQGGMAEVEGRKPATAGRKLVMDDARARPGSHTSLSAAAHAGSTAREHLIYLRNGASATVGRGAETVRRDP